MTTPVRFRDAFRRIVPAWLSDRTGTGPGKNVGFRYLWVLVSILDAFAQFILEGLQAAWPGVGTPTALPRIGQTRGIIRGRLDTNDAYAARLRAWLDKHAIAGSQEAVARAVWEYVGGVRVRVINRNGVWLTIEADGTMTVEDAPWDWDSVSNPERAGFWSELWIVIYPTPYTQRTDLWGDAAVWGDDGFGWGHLDPIVENDALRGQLAQWKSAHSYVRAVIWTTDGTLFDPAAPLTCPDGTWGTWSAGGRNLTTCRYWEFTQ